MSKDDLIPFIQKSSDTVSLPVFSTEREALAIESSTQGLWDWNLDKNQAYFSPIWKAMLGYQEDEILNIPETWLGRIHSDDLNSVNDAIEAHRQNITDSFQCDYRLRHRDGTYRWMEGRGKIHQTIDGERFIGLHSDITVQKRFQEQFRHDALSDHLTGLANRILFMEHLQQTVNRAKREKNFKFALFFLDLDKLKKINDTLGHEAGDILIKDFARKIARECREGDTVARLGGDEFTIIQPNISSEEDARTLAERILTSIEKEPAEIAGEVVSFSASIGITTNLKENKTAKNLLRDADLALYHSKSQEGNTFSFFTESMKLSFHSHFHMGVSLKSALSKREMRLFYQPIYVFGTNQIVGMEALMRWDHSRFGLISPLDFIPLAEEMDIINELGHWALEVSIQQLNEWHQRSRTKTPLVMSVNISGRQLDRSDFVDKLTAVLKNSQFPLNLFQIELTESVLASNPNVSQMQLHKLKDLGVRLALDDFGNGYSSLSILHQYPFDCLKIDRGFINHVNVNPRSQRTLRSIKQLIDGLGYDAVIEGIETIAEQKTLQEIGFTHGQGFVFCKAVPAEEFEKRFIV